MGLPLINSGVYAQVVTPMYDARQITSGTVQGGKIMWCHEDGLVVVHYSTGDENVELVAGDKWGIEGGAAVTVSTGLWSFQ